MLQGLLQDGNAIVVANAAASLMEIANSTGKDYFKLNKGNNLNKILTALAESNEWGQIYLLEAISAHDPKSAAEAEEICDRVTPRLAHSNPAVILSAVKVVMKNIDYIEKEASRRAVIKKLAAPLISLMSNEPELQYVALRNISFILQKQPFIFENNIKVFYCRFNEPVYVKLEKVEILVRVADAKNCNMILNELKEYSSDVDMELIAAAIKAIGQIVRKIESSAATAASCIAEILKNSQGSLALQDAVVAARDIMRKFPGKYERQLLDDVVKKAGEFYEVDAKASLLWIVGEYAEKIKTSQKIIEGYANDFLQEPDQVKLQILTACVKLYLKKPENSEELIQSLLKKATEEVDNPDLRDRAYIYWRMLSTSPEKTAEVVLSKRPSIDVEVGGVIYEDVIIEELLAQISSICSVYHKTPEEMCKLYGITIEQGMVARASAGKIAQASHYAKNRDLEAEKEEQAASAPKIETKKGKKEKKGRLDDDTSSEEEKAGEKKESKQAEEPPKEVNLIEDLLGMGSGEPEVKPSADSGLGNGLDMLDFGGSSAPTQQSSGFMPPPSGMNAQPATTDLLGDMLGGGPTAPAAQPSSDFNNPFGGDDMFGGQGGDNAGGDDWAGGFGDEPAAVYDLGFAKSPLVEVMPATQAGKKKNASGLAVNAAVNYHPDKNQLMLELEFRNESSGPVTDFNLMIK